MYQRILVPVDGSRIAMAALDEAIRLARLTGARLILLHVLDVVTHASGFETAAIYCNEVIPRAQRAGEQLLDAARERALQSGVNGQCILLETVRDRVSDLVVAQAVHCSADLIVIGTHGRRGLGRLLLGSDAEQILRLAPVPVLLVRTGSEEEAEAPGLLSACSPRSTTVETATQA